MRKLLTIVVIFVISPTLKGITLDECYRLSRDNYPMIRQYDVVSKLADFSFSNASRGYLPQIAFLGEATYQNDVPRFPDDMNKMFASLGYDFKGLSRDQYKLMLQLSQVIWDGGAIQGERDAVKAEEKVSMLNIDKELNQLKERINQIYFGILIMDANLKINNDVFKTLTDNLQLVESSVKNGLALESDMESIKVEILTLEQQIVSIKHSLLAYRKVLSLMIGREIPDNEIIEVPGLIQVGNENRRIELQLFDAQSAQAMANKKMVNASVMPKLDLYARGWYGRPGLNLFDDMMNNSMTWNYVAGIRLQWNISGFYTRKNNVSKIALSQESIENQKNTFLWETSLNENKVRIEIEKMENVRKNDDEIIALRRSIREASESKYKNGVVTISNLLDDITNERRAVQMSSLHNLELLKNIYDLKIMLNQ